MHASMYLYSSHPLQGVKRLQLCQGTALHTCKQAKPLSRQKTGFVVLYSQHAAQSIIGFAELAATLAFKVRSSNKQERVWEYVNTQMCASGLHAVRLIWVTLAEDREADKA